MIILVECEKQVPVEVWKDPAVDEKLCALMGNEIALALVRAGVIQFTRDSYGSGDTVAVQASVWAEVSKDG